MNLETSVRKSNELTLASMNYGLELNQMQLMSFAILNTQQNGRTEFTKADFQKQFGLTQYNTEYAKKDSQRVTSVQFYLYDDEKDSFSFQNLFLGMVYEKGLFSFKWNPDLVKHILDLKERYIMTDLMTTSKFKSSFSWTLYDFLKAKYGHWYQDFTPEEIKQFFDVHKNTSYKNNSLFKQYVLDKAVTEINAHTEFEVSYQEKRQGNRIVGFKLLWSQGKMINKALPSQIEQLRLICKVSLEDFLETYSTLPKAVDVQLAQSLVKQIQVIGLEINDSLTYEHAKELLKQASDLMSSLEKHVMDADKEPDYTYTKPQVPLFNWVKEEGDSSVQEAPAVYKTEKEEVHLDKDFLEILKNNPDVIRLFEELKKGK